MRSVVFRTPGKLDLRSITVFGLNAKPQTTNPIGFFGTGLKYAVAVLMRHKHPITIWVGDQKWTIETRDTNFRGKEFQSIVLVRHRKLLPPKEILLPFTTELGKTWELWQVFRELYANTLDEQGETWMHDQNSTLIGIRGQTQIIVEGEPFVQEFLERGKTFLPDAMRQQTTEEPVQRFDRPSKHIYWRGMRVLDLRDNEPAEFTWNILKPIDLTEDRTAKYDFQIRQIIESYVREHAPAEIVTKVVTAAPGKYERRLAFDWNHWDKPSETFIEAVKSAPQADVNPAAKSHAASYLPPEPVKVLTKDELFDKAIAAIDRGDYNDLQEAVDANRIFFLELLKAGKSVLDAADAYGGQTDQAMEEVLDLLDPEACVDCGSKGECADGCPSRLPQEDVHPDEERVPF